MIELERRIIHSPEEEPAADRVYRPRDVYFDLPFSPLEQSHRRALDECLGCMNGWAAIMLPDHDVIMSRDPVELKFDRPHYHSLNSGLNDAFMQKSCWLNRVLAVVPDSDLKQQLVDFAEIRWSAAFLRSSGDDSKAISRLDAIRSLLGGSAGMEKMFKERLRDGRLLGVHNSKWRRAYNIAYDNEHEIWLKGKLERWAVSPSVANKLRFVAQGRIDRLERKLMWREGNLPWTGWYDGLLK